MKKYITLSLTLLWAGLSSLSAQEVTQETSHLLNKQEFAEVIQRDSVQLIDIRTPKEYEQGTIDKAQNIDFFAQDFMSKMEGLDKNQPVYIFCKSGGRSAKAKQELDKQGFTKVYELGGGYLNWSGEQK